VVKFVLLCISLLLAPSVWAEDILSRLQDMQTQMESLRSEVLQKQHQLDLMQQQLDTMIAVQHQTAPQQAAHGITVQQGGEPAEPHKADKRLFATSHEDPEVLFSNEKVFVSDGGQQAWPGWLNTFNINGNIALRYTAGSQQQFAQGFSDTFRMSDFNLDFSFEPTPRLDVNLGLALQEALIKVPVRQGPKIDSNSVVKHQFVIKYAAADYTFYQAFKLKFGAFLTPFGVYNESLHSDYDSKLVERPFLSQEIIPATWTQLGVQLHGGVDLSSAWTGNYAVYMGNGLEASSEKNGVLKSTRISDMSHQLVSRFNSNRAIGGRIGISGNSGQHQAEWGLSGYRGAWDPMATLELSMLGADFWYRYSNLDLRAEWALARQDVVPGRQYHYGWYVQGAYRWNMVEPVLRLGRLRNRYTDQNGAFIDDRLRYTVGLNLYLGKFFIFKAAYSDTAYSALNTHDHIVVSTLTAGF